MWVWKFEDCLGHGRWGWRQTPGQRLRTPGRCFFFLFFFFFLSFYYSVALSRSRSLSVSKPGLTRLDFILSWRVWPRNREKKKKQPKKRNKHRQKERYTKNSRAVTETVTATVIRISGPTYVIKILRIFTFSLSVFFLIGVKKKLSKKEFWLRKS